MSSRKEILLDEILNYLLKNGTASLSLRPLAEDLRTSPRMLLFYFTSKEGLLREAMQEINNRLQQKLKAFSPSRVRKRNVAPIKLFWEWATRKENLPYFRLLYEVQITASLNPSAYADLLRQGSRDWRGLSLHSMSSSLREPVLADLSVAVFDGLMLEYIVTGDWRRLSATLDRFIHVLRQGTKSTKRAIGQS